MVAAVAAAQERRKLKESTGLATKIAQRSAERRVSVEKTACDLDGRPCYNNEDEDAARARAVATFKPMSNMHLLFGPNRHEHSNNKAEPQAIAAVIFAKYGSRSVSSLSCCATSSYVSP